MKDDSANDDETIRGGEPASRRPARSRGDDRDEGRGARSGRGRGRTRREDVMPLSDLRAIAQYQRILLFCVLGTLIAYMGAVALQVAAPPNRPNPLAYLQIPLAITTLAIGLASTVMVFLLATRAYSVGVGILLGILTLIPCLGLIVLLIINSQATSLLQRNGIRVGFMGARASDLNDLEAEEDEFDD